MSITYLFSLNHIYYVTLFVSKRNKALFETSVNVALKLGFSEEPQYSIYSEYKAIKRNIKFLLFLTIQSTNLPNWKASLRTIYLNSMKGYHVTWFTINKQKQIPKSILMVFIQFNI